MANHRQGFLFPRLAPLLEATTSQLLGPHFGSLWAIVNEPWEDFIARRGKDDAFTRLTEDEAGAWLTTQAAYRAENLLDGCDGFRLMRQHKKLVIVYRDELAITIKKLTMRVNKRTGQKELCRSNYPTPRSQNYWEQRQGADTIDLPRVMLGYELRNEVTTCDLMIAYSRTQGRAVEWTIPIPRPGGSMPVIYTPPVPASPSDQDGLGFEVSGAGQAVTRDNGKGEAAG